MHFLVLGGALFALYEGLARPPEASRPVEHRAPIIMDEARMAALVAQHQQTTGRTPDAREREALLATHRRDEALFREALRLGLDDDDAIVRRRLIQKMEFLLRGGLSTAPPDEGALRDYLREHEDELRRPSRVRFVHVFFSRDRRADARGDAERALAAREGEAPPGPGDPFLRGASQGPATEQAVAERFGPPFAQAIFAAPEGAWSGPFESSYGAHLVFVHAREPGRAPTLDEVRGQVERGVRQAQEERAFQRAVEELVDAYPLQERSP